MKPDDNSAPLYTVEVDWAPAYELIISIEAFLARAERSTMDLGADWVRRIRKEIGPALAERITRGEDVGPAQLFDTIIWRCPGDRSADGFVSWLRKQSAGDIYDLIASDVTDAEDLRDLGKLCSGGADLLEAWNEAYFQRVDPAILDGLASEAARMAERARHTSPPAVVEEATKGVDVVPRWGFERVVLVPQHHFRPWNVYLKVHKGMMYKYPAEVLPPAAGGPPRGLMRLTRALGDESRLQIMRSLALGNQTFTDIARASGLAKSTVHYHMVALRAAGLVRMRDTGGKNDTYSLRLDALARLGPALLEYLTNREETTQ